MQILFHIGDISFFILHLGIILFNLFGWLWNKTLKPHLVVIMITIFSWFILGIWYGFGYCFLTDWHWEIKRELGETDLPASFITYFFRMIHLPISSGVADSLALGGLLIATAGSVYRNIKIKRKQH